MLIRENTKRLTNVSIITLRKYNRKYELAVYPNKLIEYRNNPSISLNSILHISQIYKSANTGDIASSADLALFEMPRDDIIKYILDHGYEQKASATSKYELSAIERQVLSMLQHKVTYQGTYLSIDVLSGFVKKVADIKNESAKKQLSKIIRELEKIGFERISYKVRCNIKEMEVPDEIEIEKVEGGVLVKSDLLPAFIEYCESLSIKYVVSKNEEVESEEIC
ncbi:ribosome maturation protein SDO1 [Pancytospora epiphaga]|nr:ribosome maturation protein SDO1 [Pancytospora epiphaga]